MQFAEKMSQNIVQWLLTKAVIWHPILQANLNFMMPDSNVAIQEYTVKPVCNDHLYNKIYGLWFIQ